MIKIIKNQYIIRFIKLKCSYGEGIECQITDDVVQAGVELGSSYTIFLCNTEKESNSTCLVCNDESKHTCIAIHNVTFVKYVSGSSFSKLTNEERKYLRIIGNRKIV